MFCFFDYRRPKWENGAKYSEWNISDVRGRQAPLSRQDAVIHKANDATTTAWTHIWRTKGFLFLQEFWTIYRIMLYFYLVSSHVFLWSVVKRFLFIFAIIFFYVDNKKYLKYLGVHGLCKCLQLTFAGLTCFDSKSFNLILYV